MEITRRQVLAAVPAVPVAAALSATSTEAAIANPDPRQFDVHSGCSGFIIVQNGEQDYSLRMVSEDGNASIKFLRMTGPDAFAELSDVWRTVVFLTRKFGLPLV